MLVKPYQKTLSSLMRCIGNPGRENLKTFADIHLLSAFIVQVKKELLPVCAVPIMNLLCKCVQVNCKNSSLAYIVKIPNNHEQH